MSRQYRKTWRVTAWRESVPPADKFSRERIGPASALEITDLRVQFKIERGLTKAPNQGDIYIFNASESTRADLETKPLSVQIEAGYDDVPRLLFVGADVVVRPEREGVACPVVELGPVLLSTGHRAADHVPEVRCRAPFEPHRYADIPRPDPAGFEGGATDGAMTEARDVGSAPREVASLISLVQGPDLDLGVAPLGHRSHLRGRHRRRR